MNQQHTVTPQVLEAFGFPGDSPLQRVQGGHINDTYAVEVSEGRFVLQRINRFVFPSPENIMENIASVTEFLRKKIQSRGGDPLRETLHICKTVDGQSFVRDEAGEYWRCMTFIPDATAHETATGVEMLREAGFAFGNFQSMLSDYPAETLHEIIPKFHDTPDRFRQLSEAVEKDLSGRKKDARPEVDFAFAREEKCGLLMDLLRDGKLPLRVTHNDTKMSNVLIDDITGKAVCVIDLDTVMPGLTAFDFGDSIRAGAATAAEDETDLSKVHFDLERFEAYAKGFLSAAGDALTETELDTLPDGAILMTYEVGIRFLADFLNGDVYFRTAYPTHNLDRARNQFKLVEEMEEKREDMGRIISDCRK
ncbi:MAG: aminoglycoside phosphotransferase family protein [Acutalibacter sp.]|nr:aminoglycoside phosphotransferase family protein [Acutalibacter sp.]